MPKRKEDFASVTYDNFTYACSALDATAHKFSAFRNANVKDRSYVYKRTAYLDLKAYSVDRHVALSYMRDCVGALHYRQ